MNCIFCRSRNLRLSQIHTFDLPQFFLLRIPMRCRFCRTRMYVNIFSAWNLLHREKVARKRQHKDAKVGGDSAAA